MTHSTAISHGRKSSRVALVIGLMLVSGHLTATEKPISTNENFYQAQAPVTGVITSRTGEPVLGATVKVKGTNVTALTDEEGRFSINVPQGSTILEISYVGYKTLEQTIQAGVPVTVSLSEDDSKLREVIVVGYSSQNRQTISTAVSKLDEKVLKNVPFANAASALQGTIAGVRGQSLTGLPGAAPRIIIRGGTSINNPNGAQPLFIVDGIIRPQINNINPADIESMQVLKDAASTAVYGARGANGVVIVTTKSGKSGRFEVNYRYNHQLSKVGKTYDMASARDYLEIMRLGEVADPKFPVTNRATTAIGYGIGNDLTNNTAFSTQYLTDANRYKLDQGWQSMPDPLDPTKTIIFSDTDFQDLVFQTGVTQDHNISVSGGTDKARMNFGVGYLSNEGTVITTKYSRLTFNFNGDLKVKDNLSFFARLLYSNSKQNAPNLNNAEIFYRSAGLAPTAKYRFEDGTLAPGTNRSIGNPEYQLRTRVFDQSDDNITMSVGGKWEILPGLSFDPQVSTFRINGSSYAFQKAYWNGPLSYDVSRNANESLYRWIQNQLDAFLSYKKSFGDHNIDSRVGYTYFDRREARFNASGRGAATDIVPTLNASSVPVSVFSSATDLTLIGYVANVNYDFDRKYMVTLNARQDGASNAGDNKWGFFPGVSAGWNLDRENFWRAVPQAISSFKLRASYGVNGNLGDLGDFTSQGVYSVGTIYGGQPAIQNTLPPNASLTWERSKTFDIGADIGLVNDRINVIFDVYRRVTDQLLTNRALPPSTGFSSILTNLGSLENKGLELEVSANILPPTSKVRWNVSLNTTYVQNKVLKLPDNGVENNRIGGVYVWDGKANNYVWKGGLQEGQAMGQVYDRKHLGVYATDAEAATAPTDMNITIADRRKFGGDTRWLDADGNGIIDGMDRVYLGNIFPKWSGGFSTSVGYKGFEFYLRADYITGHMIYNWATQFLEGNLYGDGNTTQRVVDNAWRQQGDITNTPRAYWGGERTQRNTFAGIATGGTSYYWEKGDFLCLREVTLSYTFNEELVRRARLKGLRLNFTGNNLHYFTNYVGLNPEDGGVDDGRYPMPKNFIFGVNITL